LNCKHVIGWFENNFPVFLELQRRCVKWTLINSTCFIYSPNLMFDHLLESSRWDDSNKWSNRIWWRSRQDRYTNMHIIWSPTSYDHLKMIYRYKPIRRYCHCLNLPRDVKCFMHNYCRWDCWHLDGLELLQVPWGSHCWHHQHRGQQHLSVVPLWRAHQCWARDRCGQHKGEG